jgi:hypothetical protein
MAKFLRSSVRGNVTNDELVNCIGIEFLLSSKLLAKARDGKRLHSAVVLSQHQSHQRVFGECNADDLARISRDSTRSSRRRAHTIASMYQQMRARGRERERGGRFVLEMCSCKHFKPK